MKMIPTWLSVVGWTGLAVAFVGGPLNMALDPPMPWPAVIAITQLAGLACGFGMLVATMLSFKRRHGRWI